MHAGREADVSPVAEYGGGGKVVSAPCGVWGVLNVTPDSFSDGGRYAHVDQAVRHGMAMWKAGATVIDVGGESTRPPGKTYGAGAPRVPTQDELTRVVPVVQALVAEGVRVSVDTTKPEVAEQALAAGAAIVNDVSMGGSSSLLELVASAGAEVVLMHNRGRGEREGKSAEYSDVLCEALEETLVAARRAEALGVAQALIWIDPGLGFAKSAEDSGRLLADLSAWTRCGYRVLVGASRKSFLSHLGGQPDATPSERLPGSLVAACTAQAAGCAAVRVHDVVETLQALRVAAAVGARSAP